MKGDYFVYLKAPSGRWEPTAEIADGDGSVARVASVFVASGYPTRETAEAAIATTQRYAGTTLEFLVVPRSDIDEMLSKRYEDATEGGNDVVRANRFAEASRALRRIYFFTDTPVLMSVAVAERRALAVADTRVMLAELRRDAAAFERTYKVEVL
jgi:hypothetical protein